jgi:hypothetical protein
MYIVPVEVKIGSAGKISDPWSLAGLKNVQTGGGERLMEEITRVVLEDSSRLVINILFLPFPAPPRQIYVPLGSIHFA